MKQFRKKTTAFLLAAAMTAAPVTAEVGSILTGSMGIVANAATDASFVVVDDLDTLDDTLGSGTTKENAIQWIVDNFDDLQYGAGGYSDVIYA